MKRNSVSILGRITGLAVLLLLFLPAATYAQRRHRNRVVIYQPRPYVIYQRQPVYRYRTYSYSQPYYSYSNQYYSGYSQPYYSNSYSPYYSSRYYNYGYSQPYYVNRYTYVEPGYRYYRPRHRRSGINFRLRF